MTYHEPSVIRFHVNKDRRPDISLGLRLNGFWIQYFPHFSLAGYMSAMPWSASVSTFTLYKVVKVYAGTQWYATYFKTLVKVCAMQCLILFINQPKYIFTDTLSQESTQIE